MNKELTEDNACRLAKALIERYGITYEEAMYRLASFRLNLICDDTIAKSAALQAALITAVNAGGRAFLGGVHVVIPDRIPSLIPWPGQPFLSDICSALGAHLHKAEPTADTQTIFLCQPSDPKADDLYVSATGWRGGVSVATNPLTIASAVDFALGGVFAGGLAVAKGFLRVSGIDDRRHAEASGASLWNPSESWVEEDSDGPALQYLPQKLWLLGLGHLGQAYLWALGLLPYQNPQLTKFLAQDFDDVVQANLGTGLLCTQESIGNPKTRVCADWLKARGLHTQIVERPFDMHTYPNDNEPFVALCGFDSATARRILENPGFDLVVEAGIGGGLNTFDHILLHTFPGASKKPQEIWAAEPATTINPNVARAFHPDERCGVVAQTLAGKAVSSSFIGAIAGSFVIAELLRGLHGGSRTEFLRFQVRKNNQPTVVPLEENSQRRFARSGFISISPSVLPSKICDCALLHRMRTSRETAKENPN